MAIEFKNRNVLLVDDSIVRGTTSHEIVQMARESGAKKVHFASCAPPITHAHIYGIDLASVTELVAHNFVGEDAIAKHIGADTVIYQSLDDLKQACITAAAQSEAVDAPSNFEVGVFCGSYITPVDQSYFDHLEQIRGQSRKLKVEAEARRAVAMGVAGSQQIKLATNGAVVNGDGRVVPAGTEASEAARYYSQQADSPSVKTRMDIAIHNMGDFPSDT